MRICPECGRNYSDDAVVCAFDGTPLSTGTTQSWEQNRGADPAVGDVIGAYKILEKIGEGGMGVIYKAQHVRLGRHVALKVLKSKLVARSDVVNRFFKEARAVNEIKHPNIVDIYDFVEVADQDPPLVYMVMELLAGENVSQRIRRLGPLKNDQVTIISGQIADALNAVHRVKILHRDLKPENVFLLQTKDSSLKLKLLDFGIARTFGSERPSGVVTGPGSAVGTPEYMSPEQILEKELDERSDIYSLGVLLYAMLTGGPPFSARSYGEVMVKQVNEEPEPIESRRPEGDISPALIELVMKCLKKDPDRRFQSMTEVQEALKRLGYFGQDATLFAPEIKQKRSRLGPVLVGVLGVMVLLAAAAGAWTLLSEPGPEPERGSSGATTGGPAGIATEVTRDSSLPQAGPDAGAAAPSAVREPIRDSRRAAARRRAARARARRRAAARRAARRAAARRRAAEKKSTSSRKKDHDLTVDPFSLQR
jgi:serine/threonine-protein kinase